MLNTCTPFPDSNLNLYNEYFITDVTSFELNILLSVLALVNESNKITDFKNTPPYIIIPLIVSFVNHSDNKQQNPDVWLQLKIKHAVIMFSSVFSQFLLITVHMIITILISKTIKTH